VTETSLVQVVCPDCRHEFDVPDGAAEAQCPQCGEQIVWRSCLDTNEVFTVLKKWETWVHPGCETKHPVDLTHVLSAARPQDLDPNLAPVPRHGSPEHGALVAQQTVYSPVELAEDVEWADQDISGRLIVDSDRLAILPGAGATRPPLSVAWLRDVTAYAVDHVDPDTDGRKRSRFGRRKEDKDSVVRLSRLMLTVPGGQISITSTAQPDVLLAQLDQFLQPRISGQAPPVAPEGVAPEAAAAEATAPAPAAEPSEPPPPTAAAPEATIPEATASETAQTSAPTATAPTAAAPLQGAGPRPDSPAEMPDLEPDTPEAVYESIRKLAELAVLGTISSEEFATKKAKLLARL
jgi:predicted RNA-binding Zn-ribbon protein involved in translation (DUF1610 family)